MSSIPHMVKQERDWLAGATLLLLSLTLLPLVVAILVTPAGSQFMGFVHEARDGVSYIAKTTEGIQGHWTYHDPYTSERLPDSLVFLPYLLLGQAGRVVAIGPVLLIHVARLALGAALLGAIYRVCATSFEPIGQRRVAFALVILGGGLGFLSIAHAEVFGYHFVTLDIGVSGTSGLETLNVAPHIVLACLASALLVLAWARSEASARWRDALVVALITIVMSTAYPQMAALWALILAVMWGLSRTRSRLLLAAAALAGALPYVVYGLYLRGNNPAFANWPPQADVDIGDPLSYLAWGHLQMIPFAAVAVVALVRERPRRPLLELMTAWIALSAILMYVPGLPAVMHRLYYGSFIPWGILAGAGLWRVASSMRTPRAAARVRIYGTALICAVGLQVVGEGIAIPLLHRDDRALYFPSADSAALERLAATDPGGGSVVMNSYLAGLFVPALSGQRTYVGFPFETLDTPRKQADAAGFYRLTDASEIRRRAAQLHLDVVMWGTYERGFGGTDPGATAGWKVVARDGDVRLYRVAP